MDLVVLQLICFRHNINHFVNHPVIVFTYRWRTPRSPTVRAVSYLDGYSLNVVDMAAAYEDMLNHSPVILVSL